MSDQAEVRPAGGETSGAMSDPGATFKLTGSIPRTADIGTLTGRRDFYVRVYSERRDGIVAVQVFADLRSAEKKVDRVRAKGLPARMELIRVLAVMPLDDGSVIA